ncbi:MAG: methionine synthase [Candidatus Omnitrophota bacterium]
MKPLFFANITIPVPKKEIYRRLGYRDSVTRIALRQRQEIEHYIEEAAGMIRLRGAARRIPIHKTTGAYVALKGDIVFRSKNIAAILKGAEEALLMGATCGSTIMRAIKKYTASGNIIKAVVFDAAASEMADAGLDWIMRYVNQDLTREKKYLGRKRFSCGYGDFGLVYQKDIYRLLSFMQLGVGITKDFILVPEKSVTAVAAVYLARA